MNRELVWSPNVLLKKSCRLVLILIAKAIRFRAFLGFSQKPYLVPIQNLYA